MAELKFTCRSGKPGYRTRAEATFTYDTSKRGKRRAMSIYLCRLCNQWHFGTQRWSSRPR